MAENPALNGLQQVEIDAIRLTVCVAEVVSKVKNKFKYTLGGPTMEAAFAAGANIHRGIRLRALKKKLARFQDADEALEDLEFKVEVLLCAGQITPEEKAVFDERFRQTRPQVASLVTSTARRLKERYGSDADAADDTGQNPGGNAPGATSI